MMRILHVSEVAAGGVLALVRDYVRDQSARDLDVHVAGDAGLDFGDGVYHRWDGSRRRLHAAPLDAWRLRRIVAEVRPDVIHLHSFFAGVFGRLPGVVGGAAVVYQPHSWAFDAVSGTVSRAAVVAAERVCARRTHLLVTNCDDEIREGLGVGIRLPSRSVGVPVDPCLFAPPDDSQRRAARVRLGLDSRAAVVCVGRISRQKGQDLLIPAWERLPIAGAVLYLVGGGDTAAVAGLAPREWGSTIKAVGHAQEIRTWWQAADVMVMPSRYEGQSVAVSEALASGVPVVCFAVNGAAAAVVDNGAAAGKVVPVGDIDALMAEVARRVADPGAVAAESSAGRRRALRDSRPADVMDRLLDSYATAISVAGSRR